MERRSRCRRLLPFLSAPDVEANKPEWRFGNGARPEEEMMHKLLLPLIATGALAGANLCFGAETLRDCDDVQLDAVDFPAATLLTRDECGRTGGELCQGVSHAMGHRTTAQVLCYRGKTVVGGIRGTLKNSGP